MCTAPNRVLIFGIVFSLARHARFNAGISGKMMAMIVSNSAGAMTSVMYMRYTSSSHCVNMFKYVF